MKRLLLIDGHSVLYRSFYAFIHRPLRNADGLNTSAVFGFARLLRRLLADWQPHYAAVVLDAPGETFRHRQFAEYKVNRLAVPDELRQQIPFVKEIVTAWGLTYLEQPGVEADDVLASAARQAVAAGIPSVVVVSSDKDLLQLVNDRVAVHDPWKGVTYGPAEVKERLGVAPTQVPDLLALMGDASDNIPGVPGIGSKRAVEIIRQYGSLAQALATEERVRAHADAAKLGLKLATVNDQVELAVRLDDLRLRPPDRGRLAASYRLLGFSELLRDLQVQPETRVTEVKERLLEPNVVVMELNQDGGISVLDSSGAIQCLNLAEVAAAEWLHQENIQKVGFDLKPQLKHLWQSGLDVRGPLFDVKVAAWLVDSNRGQYQLRQFSPDNQPPQATEGRLQLLAQAWCELRNRIVVSQLEDVCNKIEMPLIPVLARMERRGIRVDTELLVKIEQDLETEAKALQQSIYEQVGVEFNLNSPKQLGEVLFGRLGLPKGRKTSSGFSTDADVLERLRHRHPVVGLLLRYRELVKLTRTYTRPLCNAVDPATGRVHATFEQTGTATGRLAAARPNLQNVPVRTPAGARLRRAFVAEPGNLLISADYSQIELRVLAHLSSDEALIGAFSRNEDIHISTAAAVLNIPTGTVPQEQRRLAKAINYGLVYGMGERLLAAEAGVSLEEARAFLTAHLARFAGVVEWRERLLAEAARTGVVRTLSGRMRPVPGITDRNRNVAEMTKRAAVSTAVQGSAADIVKLAMLRIEAKLSGAGVRPGMILQIHDELLFEVPAEQAEWVAEVARTEMESAWSLTVPLQVAVQIGSNWGEIH